MSLNIAKERINIAESITILTGAGVSAESGVPTFRGEDGLWEKYRAEDLATPEAFQSDPELVWRWYDWRRSLIAPLKPNQGHECIATVENVCQNSLLITQNVDGLHALAGSKKMVEIHGNIWQVRCNQNCPHSPQDWEDRRSPLPEIPPQCPYCSGLIRPNIVWFGESLNPQNLEKVISSLKCDVFLIVGTSGVVQPAASFALRAKDTGAFVIEVNLEPTPLSRAVDISLQGRSSEVLPSLIDL